MGPVWLDILFFREKKVLWKLLVQIQIKSKSNKIPCVNQYSKGQTQYITDLSLNFQSATSSWGASFPPHLGLKSLLPLHFLGLFSFLLFYKFDDQTAWASDLRPFDEWVPPVWNTLTWPHPCLPTITLILRKQVQTQLLQDVCPMTLEILNLGLGEQTMNPGSPISHKSQVLWTPYVKWGALFHWPRRATSCEN